MAQLRIDQFKGIMPRLDPSLLPDGCATVAHNLLLKNGKICPLTGPSDATFATTSSPMPELYGCYLENGLTRIANAKTLYVWHRTISGNRVKTLLAWPGVVHVAQSNIADDDRDRLFVSGETGIPYEAGQTNNQPSVYFNDRTSGSVCRRTLIKEALEAPVCTATGTVTEGTLRNTFFYQTWVDKYGYESPVSAASTEVTYYDGDTIHIASVTIPDSQAVARRIYKAVTGDSTQDNRFVVEFTGHDTAFGAQDFTVADANVGEVMPMVESPPLDLSGIVYVSGGYYAGYSKAQPHTVYFSDTQMPYSWPEASQYDIHDNIVGLATSKNSVFALTDNRVWILRGTSPDTMVASALSPAACVSKRSIVEYNNNVFYAGNNGLLMVHNTATDGDVVTNVTEKYMTKEQWRALNPSTCVAQQIDGRILITFTVAGTKRGYVFDMNERECLLSTHDEGFASACIDNEDDKMYYVKGS